MGTPQSPSQEAGTVTPINVPYPDARDLHGRTPVLTVSVNVTLGSLKLRMS